MTTVYIACYDDEESRALKQYISDEIKQKHPEVTVNPHDTSSNSEPVSIQSEDVYIAVANCSRKRFLTQLFRFLLTRIHRKNRQFTKLVYEGFKGVNYSHFSFVIPAKDNDTSPIRFVDSHEYFHDRTFKIRVTDNPDITYLMRDISYVIDSVQTGKNQSFSRIRNVLINFALGPLANVLTLLGFVAVGLTAFCGVLVPTILPLLQPKTPTPYPIEEHTPENPTLVVAVDPTPSPVILPTQVPFTLEPTPTERPTIAPSPVTPTDPPPPTYTATPTETVTLTATRTNAPTATATNTPTGTETPTLTLTQTNTPTPTATNTPIGTITPITLTDPPRPTLTPPLIYTVTPTPTDTLTPTVLTPASPIPVATVSPLFIEAPNFPFLYTTLITFGNYADCMLDEEYECNETAVNAQDVTIQGTPVKTVEWQSAATFCAYIGGRLPTVEELNRLYQLPNINREFNEWLAEAERTMGKGNRSDNLEYEIVGEDDQFSPNISFRCVR